MKIPPSRGARPPGKYVLAKRPKASVLNEQNALCIETEGQNPFRVVCVQIAGFVARRIVCYFGVGSPMKVGERFGLIRFGSRVDVYVPQNTELRVKEGERVKGGITILGEVQ